MLKPLRVVVLLEALVAVALPSFAHAQWWDPTAPDNYEDCVLEGMKGVKSDSAALAVVSACISKFPVWCEVVWSNGSFKKGSKPLLGKYKTYTSTHERGWKLIAYLLQSKVEELGAAHKQFVDIRKN